MLTNSTPALRSLGPSLLSNSRNGRAWRLLPSCLQARRAQCFAWAMTWSFDFRCDPGPGRASRKNTYGCPSWRRCCHVQSRRLSQSDSRLRAIQCHGRCVAGSTASTEPTAHSIRTRRPLTSLRSSRRFKPSTLRAVQMRAVIQVIVERLFMFETTSPARRSKRAYTTSIRRVCTQYGTTLSLRRSGTATRFGSTATSRRATCCLSTVS